TNDYKSRLMKARIDLKRKDFNPQIGKLVLLENEIKAKKLKFKFYGPFRVVEKLGSTTFKIQELNSEQTKVVSAQRLIEFNPNEIYLNNPVSEKFQDVENSNDSSGDESDPNDLNYEDSDDPECLPTSFHKRGENVNNLEYCFICYSGNSGIMYPG
ncbi:hypothetical protein ROZALSC1DRAFT_25869, partial [Rozella allomycis CSF55]